MTVSDVDWLVPHQANIRIINGMQKKMQLPTDRVVTPSIACQHLGRLNTLALSVAVGDGQSRMGRLLPSKPLAEVLSGVQLVNTAAQK